MINMNLRKLPEDLQEKAKKELNENPKRIEEDVNHLREWLSKQPHIKSRTDDQWLLGFLRGSKFSLEKAKEKLDIFYTVKSMAPEILRNRDPLDPKIQALLDLGIFVPMPKPNAEGETIVIYRPGVYDPSKFELADIFKVDSMIVDIMMMENDTFMISGGGGLWDMAGGTMNHFAGYTPSLLKKAMRIFEQAYPIRIKTINLINTPPAFEFALNILKSVVSEKLRNRLKVFPDNKFDHDLIPQSVLPYEYGGNLGSMDEFITHWKKKVESYRDWFLDEENYGTNEELRLGKPKTMESIFGADGSFRKIEVD